MHPLARVSIAFIKINLDSKDNTIMQKILECTVGYIERQIIGNDITQIITTNIDINHSSLTNMRVHRDEGKKSKS